MPTTIHFVIPPSWRDSNNGENIMALRLRKRPPLTPVPPKLTAAYPAVFDDENFSDGGDAKDAKVISPLTYDKQPIIPSPFSARRSGVELEKPKSLLSLALTRSRSSTSVTTFDSGGGSWVTDSGDDKSDNGSGGDYMPVAQQVAEDFKRDNQAMATRRSTVKSLTELISELEQSVAADHRRGPKQPPLPSSLSRAPAHRASSASPCPRRASRDFAAVSGAAPVHLPLAGPDRPPRGLTAS
ncbi:hypothetical protein F5144DRAFT_613938 [Chaetomium tenue]|uniref:Uncharacterized protein n=1 Tax=Chaetomium tenue TaxID=1854479 RepID=A0ACB7P4X4_9PEZI|nr:hypothetical protein F5144DRAFT_613938 [Chaetomium globosum]